MIKLNPSAELEQRLHDINRFIKEFNRYLEKHELDIEVDMDYSYYFYFEKQSNTMHIQPLYIALSTTNRTLPPDIIEFLDTVTPITTEYSIGYEIDGDPLDLEELLYHKVTPNKQCEFPNILLENDMKDDFIIEYQPPAHYYNNHSGNIWLDDYYTNEDHSVQELLQYFKNTLSQPLDWETKA